MTSPSSSPTTIFGYIRYFPTTEERNEKAASASIITSYLGRPLSYLWLNSTPPALIWEEMYKAYENGMRKFWMVNVGDIKPARSGWIFSCRWVGTFHAGGEIT